MKKLFFCLNLISAIYVQSREESAEKDELKIEVPHYQTKNFDLSAVQGMSQKQLEQHQKLYQGYVKKRNEIDQKLQTVNRENSAGITYSDLRCLKVAQTFALNGSLLHELYFENIAPGKRKKPGKITMQLLERNFGSLESFKKDLLTIASCARGWVLTSYNILDGTVTNYLLDAHNETVPVLVLPLLVVDVYEHAYMIDFGIDRAQYLDILWKNINWDVVEQRVRDWVGKFENFS